MPLHGTLEPGEVQPVEFMFFGHAEITADVTAACKVEGGPVYEISLQGEASKMRYKFSEMTLDLGLVMYDQVYTTRLTLYNKGKVNFTFSVLTEGKDMNTPWQPGDFIVEPRSGKLNALDNAEFFISYLPGVPGDFTKLIEWQVAHFPVDTVTVMGKAVYPQMTFDLKQDFSQVPVEILEEVKQNVDRKLKMEVVEEEEVEDCFSLNSNEQMLASELEVVLIKDFISANSNKLFSRSSKHKIPRYENINSNIIFSYDSAFILNIFAE